MRFIKTLLRRLFWSAGVLSVIVLTLEFNFFQANLRYWLLPQAQRQQSASNLAVGTSTAQAQIFNANQLVIPSLGLSLPVAYAEQANEQSFQAALQNGVAHYPTTANPGEFGNCYIFGHSSDYFWTKSKYKSAFATLPYLKPGAQILITDKVGNNFTYVVSSSKIVAADDTSVLSQGDLKHKWLTLQTSYPLGTALKRFVVIAEMK